MSLEGFRYLVLKLCEMVGQQDVKKTVASHLLTSYDMKIIHYAVVELLSDVHLFSEPCRDIGLPHEHGIVIRLLRLAVPAPAFRFFFGT